MQGSHISLLDNKNILDLFEANACPWSTQYGVTERRWKRIRVEWTSFASFIVDKVKKSKYISTIRSSWTNEDHLTFDKIYIFYTIFFTLSDCICVLEMLRLISRWLGRTYILNYVKKTLKINTPKKIILWFK